MPATYAVMTPECWTTTSFWWLEPIRSPDQSSSTLPASGAAPVGAPVGRAVRSALAAVTLLRKPARLGTGSQRAISSPASRIRTCTPAAARVTSRVPNGS